MLPVLDVFTWAVQDHPHGSAASQCMRSEQQTPWANDRCSLKVTHNGCQQHPEHLYFRAMLQFAIFLILLVVSNEVLAQQARDVRDSESYWYVQGGAYAHFDHNDDYSGAPLFGGVEYHRADDWFGGFSVFNNSYGQFSQYLYLGKKFYPLDTYPNVRVKLSVGVVHGYRGEHHDTLPVRWGESWGAAILPAIGYQKGRVGYDVVILKESGLLFLVGYEF